MTLSYSIIAVLVFLGLVLVLRCIHQRHLLALKMQINNLNSIRIQSDKFPKYSSAYYELQKAYLSSCALGEYHIRMMTRPGRHKREIDTFRCLKSELEIIFIP